MHNHCGGFCHCGNLFSSNRKSGFSIKCEIRYTPQDYSQYTAGYGLSNPVIYYQTMILMAFMFRERKLCNAIPYYFTIRNGYLYSTTILILLTDSFHIVRLTF